MFVVRPIKTEDFDAMHSFGKTTSPGISNLPAHLPRMERLINDGIASFKKEVAEPRDEIYPFILENSETGEKAGTCSILAKAGQRSSFCTFYLENLSEGEKNPFDGSEHALLYPKIYTDGPSELLALYLFPSFRKGGLGKLLSLSRFLFIANYPHRFTDAIFADMRGYIGADGICPFWNAIGARLWKCSYAEILAKLDREEISLCSLVPRFPLHWRLLPEEAQKYAGKIHPHTQAAYYMLNQQGLTFQHEISILDGGPIIRSSMDAIKAISLSKKGVVSIIEDEFATAGLEVLICNAVDFRASLARIEIVEEGRIRIDRETALGLHLDIGSPVLYKQLN